MRSKQSGHLVADQRKPYIIHIIKYTSILLVTHFKYRMVILK